MITKSRMNRPDGMEKPIAGYIDYYKATSMMAHLPSMYAIVNQQHYRISLILLNPGFYQHAYALASGIGYQFVDIIPCSMCDMMKSEALLLTNALLKIKHEVYLYWPEEISTDVRAFINVLRKCHKTSTRGIGRGLDFSVDFVRKPEGYLAYSIDIVTPMGREMFVPQTISDEDIRFLINDDFCTKRRLYHMPYRQPTFGGLSAYDLMVAPSMDLRTSKNTDFRTQFKGRIAAYDLACNEEYQEITSHNFGIVLPSRLAPLTY